MSRPRTTPPEPGLMPLRTAVILLFAVLIGMLIGWLTHRSANDMAAALVAGLTTGTGSVFGLDKAIGH